MFVHEYVATIIGSFEIESRMWTAEAMGVWLVSHVWRPMMQRTEESTVLWKGKDGKSKNRKSAPSVLRDCMKMSRLKWRKHSICHETIDKRSLQLRIDCKNNVLDSFGCSAANVGDRARATNCSPHLSVKMSRLKWRKHSICQETIEKRNSNSEWL